MSDIVNDYFKKFYPPRELIEQANPMMISVYTGIHRYVEGYFNVFPMIVCNDGFELSVQGHAGAYSYPRDDWADEYEQVEIMAIQKADPLLEPYERDCNAVGEDMIYPYVPVSVIVQIIEKHGGLTVDSGEKLV